MYNFNFIDGSTVNKAGNTWLVKTVRHVKLRNTAPGIAVTSGQPNQPQIKNMMNQPTSSVSLLRNLPPNTQILKAVPIQQQSAALGSTVSQLPVNVEPFSLESSPVTSPQLFTHLTINKKSFQLNPTGSLPSAQSVVNKSTLPALNKLPLGRPPASQGPVVNKSQEALKKTTPTKQGSGPDDPKALGSTIPTLNVVVKPNKTAPDAVNQKKREVLGTKNLQNILMLQWIMIFLLV